MDNKDIKLKLYTWKKLVSPHGRYSITSKKDKDFADFQIITKKSPIQANSSLTDHTVPLLEKAHLLKAQQAARKA